MIPQPTKKPEAGQLLTESEMSALFPTGGGPQAGTRRWRSWLGPVAVGTDTRFKFRMTFLLAIVSYYIVKLLFFRRWLRVTLTHGFRPRRSSTTFRYEPVLSQLPAWRTFSVTCATGILKKSRWVLSSSPSLRW